MNRTILTTTFAASLLMGVAPAARADVTKAQCVDADTSAQSLRREGKLAEARAMLAVCGDAQCPALVRDDCTRQIDEIDREQPTVVFDAKDRGGGDLTAVRVSVDGRPLVERIDGTPVRVDPGQHVFTFEVTGQTPVTLTLVLKASEKDRRERVTLGEQRAATAPLPAPALAPLAPVAAAPTSNRRTLAYVAGGVGIASVLAGGIFGLLASSKWTATKSECGGADSCPSYTQAASDHSATVTDATFSTVGFVAGGALLGASALLFLTAPPAVTPSVAPGSASITFTGRFQ